MGNEVTMSIKVLREVWHSRVHLNRVSFFSRLVNGLAKWAKFRIKGHWYPRTLRTFLTSLTLLRVYGQSHRLAILLGSMVMPLRFSCIPRKLILFASTILF